MSTPARKRIENILLSGEKKYYSLSDIVSLAKCSKETAQKELNKIKPFKDKGGNYYGSGPNDLIRYPPLPRCEFCKKIIYSNISDHYNNTVCCLLKDGYIALEQSTFFWEQIFEMADKIKYPYKIMVNSVYIQGTTQEEIIEKVIIAYLREYLSASNIKVQVVEKGYKLQFDSCSEYYCKDALVMLLALQKDSGADGVWLALSSLE